MIVERYIKLVDTNLEENFELERPQEHLCNPIASFSLCVETGPTTENFPPQLW